MDAVSAEQIILQASKSAELLSAFQMTAETDVDGEPKFSPRTCRDLAKAIACRNYAGAVLELCHLIHISDAAGGGAGYEFFFWGSGAARASAFRGFVGVNLRPRGSGRAAFSVSAAGVDIEYPDGGFSVTFTRMPFLSALMEFLVSAVGYGELNQIFRDLLDGEVSKRATSEQANRLSRLLYDYLKDHLPTAQTQRKFRRLIAFMESRHGAAFEAGAIDDDAVLNFWTAESMSGIADGVDFKTYQLVFKAFVRFRQTLDAAIDQYALENPRAIGADREAGEVDPDAVQALVETVDEYRSPLESLQEPPADAVKFLNKREMTAVELLLDCGTVALSLPLSLMRCEVFGKGQGQITQALRRKVNGTTLKGMMDDCAPETYAERKDEFNRLSAHVERVLLASLHALARDRNGEAISLVMALRPGLDFAPLAELLEVQPERDDNVVMLRAASVSERFLAVIEDQDKVGPEISGLMNEARKAFAGLSRQGFSDDDLADAEIMEGFAQGARTLRDMNGQVGAFVERLERLPLPASDWTDQFMADKDTFAKQFNLLYGGTQ
jgi:hypothetical protein